MVTPSKCLSLCNLLIHDLEALREARNVPTSLGKDIAMTYSKATNDRLQCTVFNRPMTCINQFVLVVVYRSDWMAQRDNKIENARMRVLPITTERHARFCTAPSKLTL